MQTAPTRGCLSGCSVGAVSNRAYRGWVSRPGGPLLQGLGFPQCRLNKPFAIRLLIKIVGCDDCAIWALHCAGVSDVVVSPVIAQDDFIAPCLACVAAQFGADAVRCIAIAVDKTQPSIVQQRQCRRISAAPGVFHGGGFYSATFVRYHLMRKVRASFPECAMFQVMCRRLCTEPPPKYANRRAARLRA